MQVDRLVTAAGVSQQEFQQNIDLLREEWLLQYIAIGRLSITRTGREWVSDARQRREWRADTAVTTEAGTPPSPLTPADLKLAILQVLAGAPPRQQHRLNIIGRPFQQGDLERHLKRQLTPPERALAAQMLKELEDAGLVLPTYRSLQDAENWLEITEAGRAALTTGILDPLDTVLTSISPHLLEIRRGAWSALRSGQPDSLRHACHSGRELIDQVIKLAAPDDVLKSEPNFKADTMSSSGVTRRMRLRFAMKKYRGAASDSELDVAEAAINLAMKADDSLMAMSHGRSTPSLASVKDALLAAEIALRRLLLHDNDKSDAGRPR